jgi:hypothetical protein
MPSILLSDNGVSSGSAGLKTIAASDGSLALQTTTAAGVATTAVTIDTSQNVGVGVTPNAWSTGGGVAIQTPAGSLWNYSTSQVNLAQNYYFDGTNYKYKNTGVASSFDQASGSFFWKTAASGSAGANIIFTQAMTLTAAGNLAIGATSSSTKLTVLGAADIATLASTNATTGYTSFQYNTSTVAGYIGNGAGLIAGAGASDFIFRSEAALVFATNGATERARIDSSGRMLVGANSSVYGMRVESTGGFSSLGTSQFNITSGGAATDFEWVLRQGARQLYYVTNATIVASLSATGVWTNASDARYKENIVDSQYGLSTVMALKPRAYNLINQAETPQIGFIAQEVLEVVPEVVELTHNSITNEDRYTLSYGNLVAVLTKAIQEQQAIINAQQAALTSLTARLDAANL